MNLESNANRYTSWTGKFCFAFPTLHRFHNLCGCGKTTTTLRSLDTTLSSSSSTLSYCFFFADYKRQIIICFYPDTLFVLDCVTIMRAKQQRPTHSHLQQKQKGSSWQPFFIFAAMLIVPWMLYSYFQPQLQTHSVPLDVSAPPPNPIETLRLEELTKKELLRLEGAKQSTTSDTTQQKTDPAPPLSSFNPARPHPSTPEVSTHTAPVYSTAVTVKSPESSSPKTGLGASHHYTPVAGDFPTSGTKPTFGEHKGTDAIFALACKYPDFYYKRFVGTLRKFGYEDDIVLAVSPPSQMKRGVEEYVKKTNVVAYAFDVDCKGTDNCQLKEEFLGYPDPRPYRTFANIRYALYEYWLQYYNENSYILILDFRDTFFQASPFQSFGDFHTRTPKYELQMFAENWKVKTIGKCVFNSMWIKKCFGKPAILPLKELAVICSGSTLGSFQSILFYTQTMLRSMDTVQCWKKGIESDQGYQNYLFYNGKFNTPDGNATLFHQGNGPVNTIGAMNGFRVPKNQKGPLDTFWKIRDKEGFVLNNDGTRSACVHQWDRFHAEIRPFLDNKLLKGI